MSLAVQKLRIYLLKHGESQASFAARAGFSANYMSFLMTGIRFPGRIVMGKIEQASAGKIRPVDWYSPKVALKRRKVVKA